MKKMMLQTILLCCLCMASCSDIEENRPVLPPDQEQEEPETSDRPQDYTKLINKTNPVPAVYEQEAQQRGQVAWYALEHTLDFFKYFMPVSADSWALGEFARHEYRPMAEYLYNALPFFFPNGQEGDITDI